MTRWKTKKVGDNVFDFIINQHETDIKNALRAAATIERNERQATYTGPISVNESFRAISMPTWRTHQSGMVTYKSANISSKLEVPSINGRGLASTTITISRIPRSQGLPQIRTVKAATSRERQPTHHSGSSVTSLSPSDNLFKAEMRRNDKTSDSEKMKFLRQDSRNNHPHYIGMHMGEPCTLSALDHCLSCGHKIMTTQPENCANNCKQPHSSHVNPRSIDEAFVCMACITQQIKEEHAEKVSSFVSALKSVSHITGKIDSEKWIAEKVNIMEIAWRDLELDRMKSEAAAGRFCYAFYVDEDYEDLVNDVQSVREVQTRKAKTESAAPMNSKGTGIGTKKSTLLPSIGIPKRSQPQITSLPKPISIKASRLPVPLKSE